MRRSRNNIVVVGGNYKRYQVGENPGFVAVLTTILLRFPARKSTI